MNLYQQVPTETIWREYKEVVLGASDDVDFADLENGVMTQRYELKVVNQVMSDILKYIPRYVTCFLNASRRRYHSWYYGITDDGYLAGFPLLDGGYKDQFRAFFDEVVDPNVAIIIPADKLTDHISADFCQETHVLMEYTHFGKRELGYTCSNLNAMKRDSIDFQIIPLERPISQPMALTKLKDRLTKNIIDVTNYENALTKHNQDYSDWLRTFTYYSGKLDLLLADPVIISEFLDFLRKYPLKPENYCSRPDTGGRCFKIGNQYIKEPPFLLIFRAFRDEMRVRLRVHQPMKPKTVKDNRKVLINRLFLAGSMLTADPNVSFYMFKMSCRSLGQREMYRAIYYDTTDRIWRFQTRTMKYGKTPSCVG